MNKEIIIKKNADNEIEKVQVLTDLGKSKDYSLEEINVADLEHQNMVETIENKLMKISAVAVKYKKINSVFSLALIIISGAISLTMFVGIYNFGVDALSKITTVTPPMFMDGIVFKIILCELVAYLATATASAPFALRKEKYSDMAEDLRKSLLEENTKEPKENEIRLQISPKLINELEENYTAKYGKIYKDLDYDYYCIKTKEDSHTNKEQIEQNIEFEYDNYDEKPKKLGQKK